MISDREARVRYLERLRYEIANGVTAARRDTLKLLEDIAHITSGGYAPPGSTPPPTACMTLYVAVEGCGSFGIPGVTVTATKAGQPTVTGVTDSTGVAALGLTASGTWSLSVPASASGRLAAASGTKAVTCPTTAFTTLTQIPATGYRCAAGVPEPIPADTMVVRDGRGLELTVTWQTVASFGVPTVFQTGYWGATLMPTTAGSFGRACSGGPGPGDTPVAFLFEPIYGLFIYKMTNAGLTLGPPNPIINGTISNFFPSAPGFFTCPQYDGTPLANDMTGTYTATAGPPNSFSLEITTPAETGFADSLAYLYGGGETVTFTIDES